MKKLSITIAAIVTLIFAAYFVLTLTSIALGLMAVGIFLALIFSGFYGWTIIRGRVIAQNIDLINAGKISGENSSFFYQGSLVQLPSGPLGFTTLTTLSNYSPRQDLATPAIASPSTLEASQPALLALPEKVDLIDALAEFKPNKAELEILFGIKEDGTAIIKPFGADTLHIANAGASGAGKSAAAQSIMFQLALADKRAEKVKFAFIDTEGKTSRPFKKAEHTLFLAEDGQEAAEVLQEIENIVAIRAKMGEEELEAEPILAVLLEEFLSLKDELGKDDWSRLVRIITKARKSKVFLLCLSQTFYSDNDTRTFKGQLRTRNCFKLEDKGTYQAFGVTDTAAISRLLEAPTPGRLLHRTSGGLILAQSPFISPKAIAEYFEKPNSAEIRFQNNPTHATKAANMDKRENTGSWKYNSENARRSDMKASGGFDGYSPSNSSASPVVEAVFYELPSPSDLTLGLKAWNNGANSIRKLQQALGGISYPKARSILQQLAAEGLISWQGSD